MCVEENGIKKLCDLVPFVQFKKREKHPFSHFLNCTNGTKLCNASPHM